MTPHPAPSGQAPVVQGSVVVVTVVGGGDTQAPLEGALRELLSRLHLQMSSGDGSPPESVLARVQIDLGSPGQATVLVTDGHTGEVRAHRIIPRDSSTAIMREEIAHAVQSAVESALIVEERAAQAPPPAPPPPPPPAPVVTPPAPVVHEAPPPPAPRPGLALDLTALAGTGPFADNVGPVFRVGGGVLARSPFALRPSLGLTAFYTVPFQSQTTLVSSYANLASLRAMPALELLHASRFALDVGAGLGIDILSVQPRSGALTQGNLDASTSRIDAIVAGSVSGRAGLAPGVVFVLAANVDVDLASRHYVLEEGSSAVAVFEPWRVRPTLFAGLEFTALGDGRFARASATEAR